MVESAEAIGAALRRVVAGFDELYDRREGLGRESMCQALVALAASGVEGAQWASITGHSASGLVTVAATEQQAEWADAIQRELGTGPWLEAVLRRVVHTSVEVGRDLRWPGFAVRVRAECGVTGVLSYPMAADDISLSLNVYSRRPDGFGAWSVELGRVVAAYGSMALAVVEEQDRTANLHRALQTRTEIGTAVGVIMGLRRLIRDAAFEVLRRTSQQTHRKVHDLAVVVIETRGATDLGLSSAPPAARFSEPVTRQPRQPVSPPDGSGERRPGYQVVVSLVSPRTLCPVDPGGPSEATAVDDTTVDRATPKTGPAVARDGRPGRVAACSAPQRPAARVDVDGVPR